MASTPEKISLKTVKQFPYRTLKRMIDKARVRLKNDEVMKKVFKDYDEDINTIDYIPIRFGNLSVSGKTDHAVIILNYKLLCDGDFLKDYSYLIHEITHYLQQTTGTHPTKSSDDGEYLENEFEQEGFANQVEYIANHEGEDEAEEYVDDLLEHHEVEDKKDKEELKEVFMSKV